MSEEQYASGGETKIFLRTGDDGEPLIEKIYKNSGMSILDKEQRRKFRHLRIAEYYVGKVLHILYPQHFPDIKFLGVRNREGEKVEMSIHEQVFLDETADEIRKIFMGKSSGTWEEMGKVSDYHFDWADEDPNVKQIKNILEKYKLPYDDNAHNFAKSTDGDVFYLDRIRLSSLRMPGEHDEPPVLGVLRRDINQVPHLNDQTKRKCHRMVNRIATLIKESEVFKY